MPSSGALFTVDLEPAWASTSLPEDWPYRNLGHIRRVNQRLLDVLKRHRVKALFYVLGWYAKQERDEIDRIKAYGHSIGSHGMWHRHGEREGDESDKMARSVLPECCGYRSPYWDSTPRPGLAGGTYFRVLPKLVVAGEVRRRRVLWIHPHDLEPDARDTYWRHKLFIGKPWEKLEYILREVKWREP